VTVTPLEDDTAILSPHDVIKKYDNTTATHGDGQLTFSEDDPSSSFRDDQEQRGGRLYGDRVVRDRPAKAQSVIPEKVTSKSTVRENFAATKGSIRAGLTRKSSIRDRNVAKVTDRPPASIDDIHFREISTDISPVFVSDSGLENKDDRTESTAIKDDRTKNMTNVFTFDSDEMLNTLINLQNQQQLVDEKYQQQQKGQQQQEGQQQLETQQQPKGQQQLQSRPKALIGRFVSGGMTDDLSRPIHNSREINSSNAINSDRHNSSSGCSHDVKSDCSISDKISSNEISISNASKTSLQPEVSGTTEKTKKRRRNPGKDK